jgi:hypothetical protein
MQALLELNSSNIKLDTYLKQFGFQFLSAGLAELFEFDETVSHSLEILLRDRSILVEVDALEVGLDLASPELRHLG